MNTTESNRLIAEFMKYEGIPKHNPTEWEITFAPININANNEDKLFLPEEMLFHSSWDWLMPVVEMIESLGYIVAIISHKTEISTKEEYPNKAHCMMAPGPKLNTTYQAVIKFIERYNRNK